MASSPKKKVSKKPAKPKAQTKKASQPKASKPRAKNARPPKKAARASKKQALKRSPAAAKKAPVRPQKTLKTNGARKASAQGKTTGTILPDKNHKERRLDPFTRGQKDKLLQLRDAMVDSMAGVAKDNLRS